MRNGVHCFSDKIALQGKKHFDIFNFPPNTVNETSFEVSKGKDGSLHMLNPSMNLVYKTTPIAMLFTKLIDRCQLDHRLANTIMFDKLPFKYDSNVFKGNRAGSSNIPLPDCLNVDEDDKDARRKFMELLQQWNQLVVLVINHFNSKGGNGGSASSAASSSSTPSATTSQDGGSSTVTEYGAWARGSVKNHPLLSKDVLVNQCCHSHFILKQLATPQVKLQFISSIFESFRGTTKNDYVDLGLVLNCKMEFFRCLKMG